MYIEEVQAILKKLGGYLVFRNLVDSSQNSRNGVEGTLTEVFGRHVATLTRRANAWSNALERFSADPNA